jgi:hypothetical protein
MHAFYARAAKHAQAACCMSVLQWLLGSCLHTAFVHRSLQVDSIARSTSCQCTCLPSSPMRAVRAFDFCTAFALPALCGRKQLPRRALLLLLLLLLLLSGCRPWHMHRFIYLVLCRVVHCSPSQAYVLQLARALLHESSRRMSC